MNSLSLIFAFVQMLVAFGLIAMLVIGARYYRRQENFSYYWLPLGMDVAAAYVFLDGINILLQLLPTLNITLSEGFQNGFSLFSAIGQLVIYFMLMILFAVGGRTLRNEKKYGWLAIGMYLMAVYLFIQFASLALGMYLTYTNPTPPMM